MKIKNSNSVIVISGISLLLLLCAGCSYIVDKIEAGITKRASFSIEGSYSGGMVTISWEDALIAEPDEAFAGYEIYVTTQPGNEFIGYETIIAPYDLGQDVLNTSFRDSTINTITFNPAYYGLNGTYFFRLGVIYWDKKTKEERNGSDDDDENTTGWMPDEDIGETNGQTFVEYNPDSNEFDPYDENQPFYENKTDLDRISGSIMIDI